MINNNRHIYFVTRLFIMCVFLVIANSGISQPESEEHLKKEAEELFLDHEYLEAHKHYSQLVSIYPKDPNYNYRLGACKLLGLGESSECMRYLLTAGASPNVEPLAFYYLGRAHHLNYRFAEAIQSYSRFKSTAEPKVLKNYPADMHIQMCNNGMKLMRDFTDMVVLEKHAITMEDFFRLYDLKEFEGKVIKKPEEFMSPWDLKVKDNSIMYLQNGADKVFFSSYGEKGKSGRDIYMARKLPNGEWGEPYPIGEPVNTFYDEDFAFIHPNGTSLYFASKGHNSMGGYDIFKSEYNADNNTFSKPVNMDYAVNTPADDFLYITDEPIKNAYFTSTRSGKQGEVMVYRVRIERIPVQMALIKGVFSSADTKGATITVQTEPQGELIGVFNTNKDDGEYLVSLPGGGKFKFLVETDFSPVIYSGVVDVPKTKTLKRLKQEIELQGEGDERNLIIRNLFDQVVSADEIAFTAELLKEKADLKVNKDQYPDESTSENASVDSEEEKPALNISNDEVIHMAYEDAETLQKEARELSKMVSSAQDMAVRKSELISQLKEQYKYANDNKQVKRAGDLKEQLKKAKSQEALAKDVVSKFSKLAEKRKTEADQAFQYAEEMESLIASDSPEVLQERLEKLSTFLENSSETFVETAVKEYDDELHETRVKSRKQDAVVQQIETDVSNLEKDIDNLKDAAEDANKKEKERLMEQAKILETDLKEVKTSLKEEKAKSDLYTEEVFALEARKDDLDELLVEMGIGRETEVTILHSHKDVIPESAMHIQPSDTMSEESFERELLSNENEVSVDPQEVLQKYPDFSTGTNDVNDSSSVSELKTQIEQKENELNQIQNPTERVEKLNTFYSDWENTLNNKKAEKNLDDEPNQEEIGSLDELLSRMGSNKSKVKEEIVEINQTLGASTSADNNTEVLSTNENPNSEANNGSDANTISPTNNSEKINATSNNSTVPEVKTEVAQLKKEEMTDPAIYGSVYKAVLDSLKKEPESVSKHESMAKTYKEWGNVMDYHAKRLTEEAEKTNDPVQKDKAAELSRILNEIKTEKETFASKNEMAAAKIEQKENAPYYDWPEDYNGYFEYKLNSAQNLGDSTIRNEEIAKIYRDWELSIDRDIATGNKLKETETDPDNLSYIDTNMDKLVSKKSEISNKKEEWMEKATTSGADALELAVINESKIKNDIEEYNKTEPASYSENEDVSSKPMSVQGGIYNEQVKSSLKSQLASTPESDLNKRKEVLEDWFDLIEQQIPELEKQKTVFKGQDLIKLESTIDAMKFDQEIVSSKINEVRVSELSKETNQTLMASNDNSQTNEVERVTNNNNGDESVNSNNSTENTSENNTTDVNSTTANNTDINNSNSSSQNESDSTISDDASELANNENNVNTRENNTAGNLTISSESDDSSQVASINSENVDVNNNSNDTNANTNINTNNVNNDLTNPNNSTPVTEGGDKKKEERTNEVSPENFTDFTVAELLDENEISITEDPTLGFAEIDETDSTSVDFYDVEGKIESVGSTSFEEVLALREEDILVEKEEKPKLDKTLKKANLMNIDLEKHKRLLADFQDSVKKETRKIRRKEYEEDVMTLMYMVEEKQNRYDSINTTVRAINNMTDYSHIQIGEQTFDERFDQNQKRIYEDADSLKKEALSLRVKAADLPKREKRDLIWEAEMLEKHAGNADKDVNKLKGMRPELEINHVEQIAAAIVNSEIEDKPLNVYKPEMNPGEADELKETETFNNYYQIRSDIKKLVKASSIQYRLATTMRNSAKMQYMAAKDMLVKLDFENDPAKINEINKKAGQLTRQADRNLANAEALEESAKQKDKLAAQAALGTVKELLAMNIDDYRKVLYQYEQEPAPEVKLDEIRDLLTVENVFDLTLIEQKASENAGKSDQELSKDTLTSASDSLLTANNESNNSINNEGVSADSLMANINAGKTELTSENQLVASNNTLRSDSANSNNSEANNNQTENTNLTESNETIDSNGNNEINNTDNVSNLNNNKTDNETVTSNEASNSGNEIASNNNQNKSNKINNSNNQTSGSIDFGSLDIAAIHQVPDKLDKPIYVKTERTASVYNEQNPIPLNPKLPEGVVYKVQIGAFRNPIKQDVFKGFAPVTGEDAGNGITRYAAGMFPDFNNAIAARDQIRALGYGDAFVVAYENGSRINVQDAKRKTAGVSAPAIASASNQNSDSGLNNNSYSNTGTNSGNLITTNTTDQKEVRVNDIAELFFTVQIGVYSKAATRTQLKYISPVNAQYLDNGTIRYSTGIFRELDLAKQAKDEIVVIGITDAFVTAYYKGERITIAKALDLLKTNGSTILIDPSKVTATGRSNNNNNVAAPSPTPTASSNATGDVSFELVLGRYVGKVPVKEAGGILKMSSKGVTSYTDNSGKRVFSIKNIASFAQAQTLLSDASKFGLTQPEIKAFKGKSPYDLNQAKSEKP